MPAKLLPVPPLHRPARMPHEKTERNQEVVRDVLDRGLTLREAAQKHGISYQRAQHIVRQARARARQEEQNENPVPET